MESESKKISIYYDGLCKMCSATMGKIEHSSHGKVFHPVDVTRGEHPEGVTADEALRHMYVVDEKGAKYMGSDGFLRILEEYPRWRWLSRIGRIWGVRQALRIGYKIISSHRRRFNSLMQ